MLKLTKTGIGLLTKQYRSVLRKCFLLNLGLLLVPYQASAVFDIYYGDDGGYGDVSYKAYLYNTAHSNLNDWFTTHSVAVYTTSDFSISDYYTKAQTDALLNYYYTKTEADAEYALLEAAIGDVDDKVEDVDDKVDAVEAKIGDLNETGIAGNDVATQLKYILENGSTGGAGVALSILGYIGANTPYLNTTNEAMNFSSTYTIGGNMSTLANQIKTNETNIDNLSSKINSLSTYSGTLDLTDNYAKVIGDVNLQTNQAALVNDGINTKAYATPNKSYTVEFYGIAVGNPRNFRVQVQATSAAEAEAKAKDEIINNGWSSVTVSQGSAGERYQNKYMYQMSGAAYVIGADSLEGIEAFNTLIQAASGTVIENNYVVQFTGGSNAGGYTYAGDTYRVAVSANSESEALEKAKALVKQGLYLDAESGVYGNIYGPAGGRWFASYETSQTVIDASIDSCVNPSETPIEGNGDLGYGFSGSSLLENVAILDSAIGDLGTTGVSGASVAAQLKLLGEVGSEALGQKIGSWTATKDSISQTLGEETKNYGYLTAFDYDSENEQYVGTVGDNLQALDTALSLTAKGLDALSYDLYNYYYTRTEADARYAKLNESNTFTVDQYLKTGYEDHLGLWFWRYGDAGNITLFSGGQRIIQLDGGAQNIQLYRGDGSLGSVIGAVSFQLNGSSTATGIDFAANVTAGTTDASHLTTTGAVNQLLNYYYTFRVDERVEAIDSASFFQKDFLTLQKVDLHIKNPTHLGVFTKCDEVCPRPSERFVSSLSQEQMLKNDASVDAGTFSICSLQIENVNEKLSNVFEA